MRSTFGRRRRVLRRLLAFPGDLVLHDVIPAHPVLGGDVVDFLAGPGQADQAGMLLGDEGRELCRPVVAVVDADHGDVDLIGLVAHQIDRHAELGADDRADVVALV